jgi:cyclic pyranopterin phosphate synthase
LGATTLVDPYNRHLNYLRVSITDRCNLRCVYCVPPGGIAKLSHSEILRYEEILRVIRVGVGMGITKVRVTGGEPLVRQGVYDFLAELTRMAGLEDVSLTTNGVLLKANIERLRQAGVRRLNVSLDTLNREKYRRITGADQYDTVWEGIQLALEAGFAPIKINAVALIGVNDDELLDLARLSLAYPLHIRFIEFMPIGKSRLNTDQLLLTAEIKRRISRIGSLVPVSQGVLDGPARRYRFAGAPGEIGFISALSHHFCAHCNRLRLTASGQLRPCLLADHHEDMKTVLRRGCSDRELAEIFLAAVRRKPIDHCLAVDHPGRVSGQMCSIGG